MKEKNEMKNVYSEIDKCIGLVLVFMISSLSGVGVFYLILGYKGVIAAIISSVFLTSMFSSYLTALWIVVLFKKKENK